MPKKKLTKMLQRNRSAGAGNGSAITGSVVAGLPPRELENLLARSQDAAAFIEGLREVAALYVRPARRRVRTGLRSTLQAAYAAVVAIKKLSAEIRNEVLSELKGKATTRTNGGDEVRIILKGLMAYAGRQDRSMITRDANALCYALTQQIPVAKFVEELSKKGESIRSWADRYAETQRAAKGRAEPRSRRRSDNEKRPSKTVPSGPHASLRAISRSGYSVHVCKHGKDGQVREIGRRLLPRKLTSEQIENVLEAAANAAPQIEAGR